MGGQADLRQTVTRGTGRLSGRAGGSMRSGGRRWPEAFFRRHGASPRPIERGPGPSVRTCPSRVGCSIGIIYVTFICMIEVREYIDGRGRSAFAVWFARLDATAAARVAVGLERIKAGNLSDARSVGSGVMEYRIHTGPGYRIYFGRDGDTLVVLLGGGTKRRQQADITTARTLWNEYERRKHQDEEA